MGVDGELRDGVLAHERLEIGPHAVGALGKNVVALVEHLVEDLQALVRQPDLVGVRIHQRPAHRGAVPVLDGRVQLAADVLHRLAHQRQQRLELREDAGDGHAARVRGQPARSPYLGVRIWTFCSKPIAIIEANIEVPP